MCCVSKKSLVTCFTMLTIIAVHAQDDAIVFQERDPAAIHDILEALIDQGVSLKDHHVLQRRTKTSVYVNESFHFVSLNGEEFVVDNESVYDSSKIKVVSKFHPEDEDTAKLLLSLLGGGSIKSVTIKKPRNG